MLKKTSIDLSLLSFLKFKKYQIKLIYLLLLAKLSKLFGGNPKSKLFINYINFKLNINKSRLTEEEIRSLTLFQVNKVNKDYKARSISIDYNNIKLKKIITPYEHALLMCDDLISKKKDIKNFVNIGARVDIVSSVLAKKYPLIDFYSVDFQENLQEHNSCYEIPKNWKFISGYPLNILENFFINKKSADVVLFSAVAPLLRNKEFKEYLAILKKINKYIIFNEPWFMPYKLNFKILKPEDIDDENSLMGGPFSNYLHNYPEILNKYGFEIEFSGLHDIGYSEALFYKAIAFNRQLNLQIIK
jgi:hypothetical protein